MWFFWPIAALVVIAIIGGIFLGGIFTIVTVPIAVIAVVGGTIYAAMGAAAQQKAGAETDPSSTARKPVTRTSQTSPPQAPSTPGELADARRGRQ
jgi:hypothetical protein